MKTLDIGDLPEVWPKTLDGEDDLDKVATENPRRANNREKWARHPFTTPHMQVTDESSGARGWKPWSDHLTGLFGWWGRVELVGRRDESARMRWEGEESQSFLP